MNLNNDINNIKNNLFSKKRSKRSFYFLFFIILFSILFFSFSSNFVSAIALGVNKAKLDFNDLLRDGYAEDTFIVSTDSPIDIGGSLEVVGPFKDWIFFEPNNFTFSSSKPKKIKVIVKPPKDAANGDYEGYIRVLTSPIIKSTKGKLGTSARAAFKIRVHIIITGIEKKSCVLGGVLIKDSEVNDPIDVLYSIKNTGNVRVSPAIDIKITDNNDNFVTDTSLSTDETILPTTTKKFYQQLNVKLPQGQYWAKVSSPDCSGSYYLTFDIYDKGTILDKGSLLKIDAKPWAETNEVIPIKVFFKNNGPRTVSAKLIGTIKRLSDDAIVKVIDTDFYQVPPSEVVPLETFFNPTKPGQYEVKVKVLYNNKLTYEKSIIINVNGFLKQINLLPIIIILIIILLLLIIIKKKKEKKMF